MQSTHPFLNDYTEATAVTFFNADVEAGEISNDLGMLVYFGDLPTFSIKYRAPIDPIYLGGCI
jgi:hypothetical protein